MSPRADAELLELPAVSRRPIALLCYRAARLPWRKEEGQSMVELALTLPVLMMFIIGFMQFCLVFYTYNAISEMAREGTRYAMVRGASCVTSASASCTVTAANVNSYVQGITLLNGKSSAMTVSTTYPDGNESAGSRVKVSISYVYGLTIPFTKLQPITLNTSSMTYIIQ